MNSVYEKLLKCYDSVREKTGFKPKVALVLGSGLGDYGESIQVAETLDYHAIEGFPVSTVQGHKGRFIFGYVNQVPVVIMQGRVHYYDCLLYTSRSRLCGSYHRGRYDHARASEEAFSRAD